jgi:hypothetical protein
MAASAQVEVYMGEVGRGEIEIRGRVGREDWPGQLEVGKEAGRRQKRYSMVQLVEEHEHLKCCSCA